nr:MAG TPA: hypothetical protein [Crassvirales sp.]
MTEFLNYEGLKVFKQEADVKYLSMPTYSTISDLNKANETGIYPKCTSNLPNGISGSVRCIVFVSTTINEAGQGYYIDQTAYGQGAALGRIFKRIGLKVKNGTIIAGKWIEITNNSNTADEINVKKLLVESLDVAVQDDISLNFKVPKSIADNMLEIQSSVPCNIKNTQDGSIITSAHFPLNSLGYKITQLDIDDSDMVIIISIDKNITYKNAPCEVQITESPNIVISYIE